MRRVPSLAVAAAFLIALTILAVLESAFARVAAEQNGASVQAPRFEVDPLWPKPLPNHWLLGMAIGVAVDAQDHIWIVHRSSATLDATERGAEADPPLAECCKGAPPVLAFDQAGNLIKSWGGPGQGYEWPESNHGIFVDDKNNVWIGGNGPGDSQILKFTADGKFLQQFGKASARRVAGAKEGTFAGGSSDRVSFGRVAKIFVDPRANEAFIADGYLNKRVAVLDATSGALKRFWGAYGNAPDDTNLGRYNPDAPPVKQFRNPVHCADLSKDGFLYVCDRVNNRLQVFSPDGKFLKEQVIARSTLGAGAVWDIAFSRDAQQKYLYVADGQNQRIYVLERQTLQLLTSFGDGGRQPGQFFGVHSLVTDSAGNLYSTETYEGKRLQRFVFKGVGAVPSSNQGALWPKPTSSQ